MPGTTPIFGIRYPCQGEQIKCDDFQNFAEDVDGALADVSALRTLALNRPSAAVRTFTTGFSVPAGAETTIIFDEVLFNNGMFIAAGPIKSAVLALRDGVYMCSAEFSPVNAVTTLTQQRASLHGQTASEIIASRTLARSVATTNGYPMNISGVGILGPATLPLEARWTWSGTGGPMFVYCHMTIAFVCDL
jgi:hypothetical protein